MAGSVVSKHRMAAPRIPLRIGVDTGGTFTDCVVLERGQVKILTVFSTPANPSRAIVQRVMQLAEDRERADNQLAPEPGSPPPALPAEVLYGYSGRETRIGQNHRAGASAGTGQGSAVEL